MLGFCLLVSVFLLGMLGGVCQYAALVKFYPYNLSWGLQNYNFDVMDGGGWDSYWNSIRLASYTAVAGTIVVFAGAFLVEKGRGFRAGRILFQLLAMMPMAVPGLVLGLAYIFFFNHPDNPLGFLYHTMGILVISTIVHFYTVAHLTAVTALKQMDPEFESVAASLKAPFYKHVLAGDGTGVSARDPRHNDLPVRERDDHGVRGGVHLRPGYETRIRRGPQHGPTRATSLPPPPWA